MATELEKLKDVVLKFEDTKRNAYIPTSKGTVVGKSGVTIGKGLDLGQQSTSSINALKDYGLSEELAKKLRDHPDLGKKFTGKKASEITFSPLSLTTEEEEELNKSIIDKYKKDFYDAYETNVGRKITDDLTENQRIALTSASFNLGVNGLFKKKDGTDTNFKTQLVNKEYDKVAKNLGTWSKDNLKYRRAAEAALFGNYIDTSDVGTLRDSFYSNRTSDPTGEGLKAFQDNLKVLKDGAVKESTIVPADRLTPQQMEQAVQPNSSILDKIKQGFESLIPSAQAEELPVSGQPTYDYIPQQAEPQYATMEELLGKRNILSNDLLYPPMP